MANQFTQRVCLGAVIFLALFLMPPMMVQGELKQEIYSTHHRIKIDCPNNRELQFQNETGRLVIKSTQTKILQDLQGQFAKLAKSDAFIEKFEFLELSAPEVGGQIVVQFKKGVDSFVFYKQNEKKYVVDYWPQLKTMTASVAPKTTAAVPAQGVAKAKTAAPAKPKKVVASATVAPKVVSDATPDEDPQYRDFRYGASFVWSFEPVLKEPPRLLNIEYKTPDFLIKLENRPIEKSEQEAHLQLSINLYKKKKWGLMSKSIELYNTKYGENSNFDVNAYLRAGAILNDAIAKNDENLRKVSHNLFEDILDRTTNYDLKRGIYKYLIQFYTTHQDYVRMLKLSQRFYVESKSNYDDESEESALHFILYALAKLEQEEKILEVLSLKAVQALLSQEQRLQYLVYVYLRRELNSKVINLFESYQGKIPQVFNAELMFNVAEAYFREANYQQALKYLDTFIQHYAHVSTINQVRLRLAMVYDLLDSDPVKTLKLYEEAINKMSDMEMRYEAQIRYVGIKILRNKKITADDWEILSLLNHREISKHPISDNVKKLLWSVRLRSYILKKEYDLGFEYYTSIPLALLLEPDRIVFERDMSEIIHAKLMQYYHSNDWGNIVYWWEKYKDKYFQNVMLKPHIAFMVVKAYLKLRMTDKYEKLYAYLRELSSEVNLRDTLFPIWVEIEPHAISYYLTELDMEDTYQREDWEKLAVVAQMSENHPKKFFYLGMTKFKRNEFNDAVGFFEQFLVESPENVLTGFEVVEFFRSYGESLYQSDKREKFVRNTPILVRDMKKLNHSPELNLVIERLSYLYIEAIQGSAQTTENQTILAEIRNFLKEYPKSSYAPRLRYLSGVMLQKSEKYKEATEIFKSLVDDKEVYPYIKEMAKSELSTLKILQNRI